MSLVFLALAASPHVFHLPPGHTRGVGVSAVEYFPVDAGFPERLAVVQAQSESRFMLDPLSPLVAIGPQPVWGPADRCEDPVGLRTGERMVVLRTAASPRVVAGPAAKRNCAPDAPKLQPLTSQEKYPIGMLGQVEFLGRTSFAYAGRLTLNPDAVVKPHQHDGSVEIVLIEQGTGTFTVEGESTVVGPNDAVRIPAGTQHAFTAGKETVVALQFYLPPGPEQRFRPGAPAPPPAAPKKEKKP